MSTVATYWHQGYWHSAMYFHRFWWLIPAPPGYASGLVRAVVTAARPVISMVAAIPTVSVTAAIPYIVWGGDNGD